MKIGELAKLTGVATSRIRFYEKHGLMPRPSRQDNGYRDYPESMTSRLHMITMSKALGFSLSEIRRFLPDDSRENMKRQEIFANMKANGANSCWRFVGQIKKTIIVVKEGAKRRLLSVHKACVSDFVSRWRRTGRH